jgi:fructose 1,6-bisphosphate aldolase/phosphatase
LMPSSTTSESASRAGGPPRAIGLGFQVAGRRLVGPRDLLGDAAFDEARRQAVAAGDYLRRHGTFAPFGPAANQAGARA